MDKISSLTAILADTFLTTKQKTEMISRQLLDGDLSLDELIHLAENAKDPIKATCIEAVEFASNERSDIGTKTLLDFVSKNLGAKAPRVKWESAKVIAHIAPHFPDDLGTAINNLLINTEHTGTVVRWSAATALGEILKLNNTRYKDLRLALEAICEREEKNSIRKIYQTAFKKAH